MTCIAEMKKDCRASAIARVKHLTESDRRSASINIQSTLLALPEFKSAPAVFTYLSFGSEIETDAIIKAAFACKKSILVPAFCENEYRLVRYREGDALISSHYGIMEPECKDEAELPMEILVILPALAFDRACHRLGRGGGYYDRMLERLTSCGVKLFNAGLGYACNLCSELPVEPFDFDVDIVITENESVRKPR
jgi:5-formyltetrahydrofolate cyclo-ligase